MILSCELYCVATISGNLGVAILNLLCANFYFLATVYSVIFRLKWVLPPYSEIRELPFIYCKTLFYFILFLCFTGNFVFYILFFTIDIVFWLIVLLEGRCSQPPSPYIRRKSVQLSIAVA